MATNIIRYYQIILLLSICVWNLHGQEHYNIPLSSAKYFDNNVSYSAALDTQNNLWVGTEKGLYRFDGGQSINAKSILDNWDELSEAHISDIWCDSENKLWINTKTQGVAVVELSQMKCTRIYLHNEKGERITDYNLQDLKIDDKSAFASLWTSSDINGGILTIDLYDYSTSITPLKDIIVPGSLLNDKNDKSILWVTGESLIKYNKSTSLYEEIEYDSTINAEHLISISENGNGDLLIVLRNALDNNLSKNILRYNKAQNQWTQDKLLSNLSYSINYTSMYNDSLLLITTSDDVKYQLYDTYHKNIIEWDLKDQLIKSEGAIVKLRNGDIAILGYNVNYLKKTKKAYRSIPLEENPKDKDNFYGTGYFTGSNYILPKLGPRDYYYSFDTTTSEISQKPLDKTFNYRAFYKIEDDKTLAVARDGILSFTDGYDSVSVIKSIDQYLPNEQSSRMFYNSTSDAFGNVWITTSHNSVLQYNLTTDSLIDYKLPSKNGERSIFVFDIASDSLGNIFAAGRYEVLYKSLSDTTFVSLLDRFPNLELPDNLIPYSIASTGPNEILLGTWAKGMYRINTSTNNVERVGPKINNNYIEAIRPLSKNRFILLSKFHISLYDSNTNEYKLLNQKNGITTVPLRNPATFQLHGADVITWNNDLRILPVDSLFSNQNQQLNFSRLSVNGKSVEIKEHLSLGHEENNIMINYALSEYDIYNQVRYRYQLLPDNDQWIEIDNRKELMLANLSPNTYKLKIQSTNIDGFWIDNIKQLEININPPWYATLWFKILMTLLSLIILWSLISFYINYQKKNLENEKRFAQLETMILKSQMNPHFIFNSLNSIRYLFMKDQKNKGLKYITKFAKLLRSTLHHGETALVKLSDEIELTELFIELEQLRFEDKFEYIASFCEDENWMDIKIPPFVIQPLVENAFWHGLSQSENPEKQLKIEIQKSAQSWLVHVEDNGIGMGNGKPSVDLDVGKKKSYGLSLIQERFDLINKTQNTHYSVSIHSTTRNAGTKVTISITPNL